MPPATLRPRSTPELIDAAVSLLRQHYLELVTVNALFTVPMLVFTLAYTPYLSQLMPQPGIAPPESGTPLGVLPPDFWRNFGLLMLASIVLGAIANAATVVIVSDNYMGVEVTISSAVQRAFDRLGAVLVTGVLQWLAIFVGVLFFIIPGFFCVGWFFAAVNVVMAEGKGPIEALGRSHALAKGSVGRILGTFFIAAVIMGIVEAVLKAVIGLLIGFSHPTPAVTTVVGTVVNVAVVPFFGVLTTLLYYDLRIRKEGLDLDIMARELGVAPPAPAPA